MQHFSKKGIGGAVYNAAAKIESGLAGLKQNTLEVNGLPISYYESTPKRPKGTILLLHGFSANKTIWVRFAKHLSRHYRVLIPDLPGHGDTPYDSSVTHNVPIYSDCMQAFLSDLRVSTCHIAGNSMGGQIAAQMALDAPDLVQSLGLFNPSGVAIRDVKLPITETDEPINHVLANEREDFNRFYNLTMHCKPFVPGFVLNAIADEYIEKRHALKNMLEAFYHKDLLQDRLKEISCPALLLWGRKDALLDVKAAPIWEAGLNNVTANVLENIGHMPMVEDPRGTAEIYLRHIKDC